MNSLSILLIANFGNINGNVLEKQLREKQLSFREISLHVKILKNIQDKTIISTFTTSKKISRFYFFGKKNISIKLGRALK
jgi:S-adenosylmethionine hydrolase